MDGGLGTKAIDIPCAKHGMPAGERCPGDVICTARSLAAARLTRAANLEARKADR